MSLKFRIFGLVILCFLMLAMLCPTKVSAVENGEDISIISDYDTKQCTFTYGIHPGNDTNVVDFPSSVNIPALFDVGCTSLYVVFGKKSSVLAFVFNIGSNEAKARADQWAQIIETAFSTTFTWQDTTTSSSYVYVRYTNAGATNATIYRSLLCIKLRPETGGFLPPFQLADFASAIDYNVGIGARDEPSKGPDEYDIGLTISYTKKMSTGTGDPTIDVLDLLGVTSLAPSSYFFNSDTGIYLSTINLTINSSTPLIFVSCEPSPLNPPGTRGWYSTPSTSKIDAQFKFMNDSTPVSHLTFTFTFGEPIKPRLNGEIAFQSNRDGNWEIYVMNPDGSGQTRLTSNTVADEWPCWSPDGTKIAFSSNREGGNMEIYVMNADGTGVTRLTYNNGHDYQPCWSPDGSRIAFSSTRDGNYEIYVMNSDGTGENRLTNNIYDDDLPRWSPDNTKIAFESNRDGHWEIYTMNTDGSGQTRITTNSNENPCWSPDGSRIMFTTPHDSVEEIWIMNADGSGQMKVTTSSTRDYLPYWSPDGTRVVFVSTRDGNDEIYVMNVDGSGQTRLTNNGYSDYDPSWQGLSKQTAALILQSSTTSTKVDTDFLLNATLSVSKSGTVTLYWSINGSGFDFSQTGTMTNGRYNRVFAAGTPGVWTFKVVWAGDDDYESAESNNITVTIQSLPALAVVATASPAAVYSGGTSTIKASLTSGGTAITGATVNLTSGNGGTFSTVTDQGNGTYVATFTAPDIVTQTVCTIIVSASKSGYQSGLGQKQVTVQPLVINIYMKTGDGTPIAGATVVSTSQPSGQATLSGSTDANGLVVFTNILKGSYTIKASKPGYEDATWTGTISSGQATTQNIVLSTPFPMIWAAAGAIAVVGIVIAVFLVFKWRKPKT